MKPDLSPYLAFEGKAREALNFYAEALGGDPSIYTYGSYDASDDPRDRERVLYGVLRTPDGFVVRVTDVPVASSLTPGDNYYICISGDDEELIRRCWSNLSEEATITIPLETASWGDAYGQLIDKFGVTWQINIGDSE
ncbi:MULTISPECIES: VOC family protein [Actinomyces]|nr:MULTISPECIES: VOC family protein [Actinomyces]